MSLWIATPSVDSGVRLVTGKSKWNQSFYKAWAVAASVN